MSQIFAVRERATFTRVDLVCYVCLVLSVPRCCESAMTSPSDDVISVVDPFLFFLSTIISSDTNRSGFSVVFIFPEFNLEQLSLISMWRTKAGQGKYANVIADRSTVTRSTFLKCN